MVINIQISKGDLQRLKNGHVINLILTNGENLVIKSSLGKTTEVNGQ